MNDAEIEKDFQERTQWNKNKTTYLIVTILWQSSFLTTFPFVTLNKKIWLFEWMNLKKSKYTSIIRAAQSCGISGYDVIFRRKKPSFLKKKKLKLPRYLWCRSECIYMWRLYTRTEYRSISIIYYEISVEASLETRQHQFDY